MRKTITEFEELGYRVSYIDNNRQTCEELEYLGIEIENNCDCYSILLSLKKDDFIVVDEDDNEIDYIVIDENKIKEL